MQLCHEHQKTQKQRIIGIGEAEDEHGRRQNPLENPDYRELHVRWMEFGTFCPMMRSHGEGYPRELYQFGKKGNVCHSSIL